MQNLQLNEYLNHQPSHWQSRNNSLHFNKDRDLSSVTKTVGEEPRSNMFFKKQAQFGDSKYTVEISREGRKVLI